MKSWTDIFHGWSAPTVKQAMPFAGEAGNSLSPEEHENLVKHLLRLLYTGEPSRHERNSAMEAIETDLLGVVTPSGTDCERKRKRNSGEDVSVPDAIYPFGWLELQKFTSEIAAIVMPAEAPYFVVTPAAEQELATGLARALRHQAAQFDHRNNFHGALFDSIALDLGGLEFRWDTIATGKTTQSLAETMIVAPDDFAGAAAHQLDPYNMTWDPNVPVPEVALRGEFFAHFSYITPFELQRTEGLSNFLPEAVMKSICTRPGAWGSKEFPHNPSGAETGKNWFYYQPTVAISRARVLDEYGTDRNRNIQTNHSGTFSQHNIQQLGANQAVIHKTVIYVRLKPSKWGLTPKLKAAAAKNERFEVWEIHLIENGYIAFARRAIFDMDRMPIAIGTMNHRRTFGRSFRMGEHAAQVGLLASTIMNMQKRAMRKGLEGGLTIYNPKVFDLSTLDDTAGGRLPARMQSFDDDIRRHIMQLNDVPDYKNTLRDVEAINGMLGRFFPSNSQTAVAGLDRGTQYQAQAVMMTGARLLLFYAALADGSLMAPMRFGVYHLNLLHAGDMEYVDETTRQLVTLTRDQITSAEFRLVQSQPLMGIDRLRAGNVLRDVVNILFQSQGQLPPLANAMLKHFIQIEGLPLSMAEYEKAANQQMQMQAEQMAMQQAEAGGATGAPAAAQGAANQALSQ